MASTLSRVTTFMPSTPILSSEVNAELNQIVNLLNGTTTNQKVRVRTSDAGDPPLELDQLSTGPIAEFYQGGVLRSQINNDGSFQTADQFISTVTTGTAPLVVSSTTAVTNLNADQVDGLHASSFVRKDDGSAQTIISQLNLSKTVPRLFLIDSTAGDTGQLVAYPGNFDIRVNSDVTAINLNVSTAVATFSQIPVGPASDPTTGNQLTRKTYVDNTIVSNINAGNGAASPAYGNMTIFGTLSVGAVSTSSISNGGNTSLSGTLSVGGKAAGFVRRFASDSTSPTSTTLTAPANSLATNNDFLRVTFMGTINNGASITFQVAGNTIGASISFAEGFTAEWNADVTVIRISSTQVRATVRYTRTHDNYDDSATAESTARTSTINVSDLASNTLGITASVTSGSVNGAAGEFCSQ